MFKFIPKDNFVTQQIMTVVMPMVKKSAAELLLKFSFDAQFNRSNSFKQIR